MRFYVFEIIDFRLRVVMPNYSGLTARDLVVERYQIANSQVYFLGSFSKAPNPLQIQELRWRRSTESVTK
jgi:hypothetical protein